MKRVSPQDLAPSEIREIRESLGLSQAEAGELLGGGPKAFSKYENGAVRPTAATANLLRLLRDNPHAAITLTGRKPTPIASGGLRPFEVTGAHVSALTERKLANLVQRLLSTEAQSADLPADGVHVATEITTPDGGEDARIQWEGGPERTEFLPGRLCSFQLKAGPISPAKAGKDVIARDGTVQPMVLHTLQRGGFYIMLSAQRYTRQQVHEREEAILKNLKSAGFTLTAQIQFRDADQIASWVNARPSVAIWLLEQTQPGLIGPFHAWTNWAGRHEHDASPWIEDGRLGPFHERLRALIVPDRGVARVVGLSGVGKSRLVLEALGATPEEENAAPRLSDLVLYAIESEAGTSALKNLVQSLAVSGMRAVVVVDRCSEETHQDLAAMTKRSSSRLSLVTIDHEIPRGQLPLDTLLVDLAEPLVTDGILTRLAPNLPSEDQRRLASFSKGFPQLARLVAEAWRNDISIASATDEVLINRIVIGRSPLDPALTREAAMLLSAFGLVGIGQPLDSDLVELAKLSRDRKPADLRAAYEELTRRGVAQRRGRLITLQPRPIALSLAERQWSQWSEAEWDNVLVGSLPEHLRKRAARQLSLLNTRPIATTVVDHVCRLKGPLATIEGLAANHEVLSALAEIDAAIVVRLLERVLGKSAPDELRGIGGDLRRNLVRALNKIAFLEATFERGARLLLALAVVENERWANNASGEFKSLFPVLLADTEAGPEARLRLVDEIIDEGHPAQLSLIVDALTEGSKTDFFSRSVGAEIHGSRPALEPWRPHLDKEVWDYIRACSDRLADLATRSDDVGEKARKGLGHHFRGYVVRGLLDDVQRWVDIVSAAQPYWPEALASLGDVLQYDAKSLTKGNTTKLRALIARLTPRSLDERVRFLVTEMPWDFPGDEKLDFQVRQERQVAAVDALVVELLSNSNTLGRFLPQLSRGQQRMAADFGRSLARRAIDPLAWRDDVVAAVEAAPVAEQNFSLLAGYFSALGERDAQAFEAFKTTAARSPVLARSLPFTCLLAGITPRDVLLVREALSSGYLAVDELMRWTLGGVLAKVEERAVAPLFDDLLRMPAPAFSVTLELMGMYVFGQKDRLDRLRPQLRAAGASLASYDNNSGWQMDAHHFEELMLWLLKKGPQDQDAAAVALMLAKQLADSPGYGSGELAKPLLPTLLSAYAHIVWPILGQAVVADARNARELEQVLSDRYSFDDVQDPPILNLPEDMLFAWCHAHPEVGPAFVARAAPILTERTPGAKFHPVVLRLFDEFGDRDDMLRALVTNMHNYGWTGSRTTYFALYEAPLRSIEDHPIGTVRRWAARLIVHLQEEIAEARTEDEEESAAWDL